MAESLGRYRKVYASGLIEGRRINAVSLQAEAWFWRLLMLADDYGNLPADPDILRGRAAPMRKLTVAQARKLTDELESVKAGKSNGLVSRYTVDGEEFLHIDGYDRFQTAPNGRRTRRYPLPDGIQSDPDESCAILRNPKQEGSTQKPHSEATRGVVRNPVESCAIRIDPGNPAPPESGIRSPEAVGRRPKAAAPPPEAAAPEPAPAVAALVSAGISRGKAETLGAGHTQAEVAMALRIWRTDTGGDRKRLGLVCSLLADGTARARIADDAAKALNRNRAALLAEYERSVGEPPPGPEDDCTRLYEWVFLRAEAIRAKAVSA